MSAAEFISKYPGWYLFVTAYAEALNVGFRTTTAVFSADRVGSPDPLGDGQIVRIRKRPGLPYPDRVSVGRTRVSDITLRDSTISKLHAYFLGHDGTGPLRIVDVDSHNGTLVNDQRVSSEPVTLADGDLLQFGSVKARLVDAQSLYDLLR